jgi:hypothetical protein
MQMPGTVSRVRIMRKRWWAAPVAYKYAVWAYLKGW